MRPSIATAFTDIFADTFTRQSPTWTYRSNTSLQTIPSRSGTRIVMRNHSGPDKYSFELAGPHRVIDDKGPPNGTACLQRLDRSHCVFRTRNTSAVDGLCMHGDGMFNNPDLADIKPCAFDPTGPHPCQPQVQLPVYNQVPRRLFAGNLPEPFVAPDPALLL